MEREKVEKHRCVQWISGTRGFEGTQFHVRPRLRIRGAKPPLATGLQDVLFCSAEGLF